MKLVTFEVANYTGRTNRVGAMVGDRIIDLTNAYEALLHQRDEQAPERIAQAIVPPDMLKFLENGARAFEAACEALSFVNGYEGNTNNIQSIGKIGYDRDSVRLLSPLPRPNSLRDFLCFEDHLKNLREEVPDRWYEMPPSYMGNVNTVVPSEGDVKWPSFTEKLDFEMEVAAVIGKEGRDIPASKGEEYIAGYTIFNDFSARDIQYEEMELRLGPAKGKNFANALGPCLVPTDELEISEAAMEARLNDETLTTGLVGEMYHTFGDVIAHASMDETIRPGDVFGSGTVGMGSGIELDVWLQPGDIIELEIEGIGVLRNRIVDT